MNSKDSKTLANLKNMVGSRICAIVEKAKAENLTVDESTNASDIAQASTSRAQNCNYLSNLTEECVSDDDSIKDPDYTDDDGENMDSSVLAEAVRTFISDQNPGPYDFSLNIDQANRVNQNLLGFKPLGIRRPEAKNLAFSSSITAVDFPCYPANTALNFEFLNAVSNVLSTSKTFKVSDVIFTTLAEPGAQSQEGVPNQWIANRNARRNLPIQYLQEVFQAISLDAATYYYNPTYYDAEKSCKKTYVTSRTNRLNHHNEITYNPQDFPELPSTSYNQQSKRDIITSSQRRNADFNLRTKRT
ncbi:unnamed protein product [Diabrotica balteata]|uniref:Uncharacterized protein n=1 Tax=Diabrotica balteata TaxID=107213 RepID=A0A9N9TDF2_DIABA|nr:unnamed protein product [Diabrotica balteata]